MISERVFAQHYTAFWQRATPTGAHFVRYVNLQRERFGQPLTERAWAARRGFVNEVGFRLFVDGIMEGPLRGAEYLSRAERRAAEVSTFLRGIGVHEDQVPETPDIDELREAADIANCLLNFFDEQSADTDFLVQPTFAGCGILSQCEGDVLSRGTLYEVKAGARDFLQIDVRQLLIYAALNHIERKYSVTHLALLNPREGVVYRESVDYIAGAVSGISSASLFLEIADFVSLQEASH